MNQNNNNNMRSASLSLSLLMAASLALFTPVASTASLPPADTGQQLQQAEQVTPTSAFTLHAEEVVLTPGHTLNAVADSGFNPRTDFPTRPVPVMTAGFATLDFQECCGGNGSWNYAEKPADRTLAYIGAVLFAAMLLAAAAHRIDRRRTQHQVLATH